MNLWKFTKAAYVVIWWAAALYVIFALDEPIWVTLVLLAVSTLITKGEE